jgi:1,6-anhydro-N-acetylmuramate kinase
LTGPRAIRTSHRADHEPQTDRNRVSGWGSQCAFIAGALKTLFARGVQEQFEIVGLSGTSGGALTAAVAWFGLLKRAQGDRTLPEDRVLALVARL